MWHLPDLAVPTSRPHLLNTGSSVAAASPQNETAAPPHQSGRSRPTRFIHFLKELSTAKASSVESMRWCLGLRTPNLVGVGWVELGLGGIGSVLLVVATAMACWLATAHVTIRRHPRDPPTPTPSSKPSPVEQPLPVGGPPPRQLHQESHHTRDGEFDVKLLGLCF